MRRMKTLILLPAPFEGIFAPWLEMSWRPE